jgi:carbon monoxide dehydrogenase subunit G
MALKLKGEHKVALGQEQVWCLLNDPAVLQEVIPGCEKLTRVAEDKYELGLDLLIGSVSGSYKGSVELSDKKPIDHYDLKLVGEGSIGFVKGSAHFVLTPKDDVTVISYDGEAEVGGLVAGVGNRVLGGVAKFMVGRFFKAFDKYIKEHDVKNLSLATAGQSGGQDGAR